MHWSSTAWTLLKIFKSLQQTSTRVGCRCEQFDNVVRNCDKIKKLWDFSSIKTRFLHKKSFVYSGRLGWFGCNCLRERWRSWNWGCSCGYRWRCWSLDRCLHDLVVAWRLILNRKIRKKLLKLLETKVRLSQQRLELIEATLTHHIDELKLTLKHSLLKTVMDRSLELCKSH
jgi:hypothetical protein